MNKETLRMQMLAGIITESEYKVKLYEASINNKGELEDLDFEDNDTLSKEEWNRYKKEFDSTGLNWLLRQFLVLDGEEERTKDYWDYDIDDIRIKFKIPDENAASLIYDIFQILGSGFKSGYFFPKGATDKDIENIQSTFSGESYQIKKERIQKLAKGLSQYATPKELFDNDWDNWESMAYLDDYNEYLDYTSDN
jgi:hypothetical protein